MKAYYSCYDCKTNGPLKSITRGGNSVALCDKCFDKEVKAQKGGK
jgi:hypothetical protein